MRRTGTKPAAGTRVNWGHPLTNGLVGCWFLNEAAGRTVNDAVSGRPGNLTTVNWGFQADGSSLDFPSTSGRRAKVRTDGYPILGGRPDWTICASVRTQNQATGGGRGIYCERSTSSGNDIVKMNSQDTGISASSNLIITYRNDGGTLTQLAGTSNIQGGGLHHCAVTKRGTSLGVWVDGVKENAATFGSSSNAFTDAAIECGIGNDTFTGDSNAFIGQIGYVFLFARELNGPELKAIASDPYQIAAIPSPVRKYFIFFPPPAPPLDDWHPRIQQPYIELYDITSY